MDGDEVVLGDEQGATSYFCNGIEPDLISKFADSLFGCIVDAGGMNGPKDRGFWRARESKVSMMRIGWRQCDGSRVTYRAAVVLRKLQELSDKGRSITTM